MHKTMKEALGPNKKMQFIKIINYNGIQHNSILMNINFEIFTLSMNTVFLFKLLSQPNVICSTVKGYYKHYT